MSLQKLMTNYAAYNQWANSTITEWLGTFPSDSLYEKVPSSFPSLVKTLNHILAVEEFWYSVITRNMEVTGRYLEQNPYHEEVIPGLAAQSAAIYDYVKNLTEEQLLEEVYLETPWVQGTLPRYEFIQHCLNHSTYHRGQITSMSHHLQLKNAPMTDYNFFNMKALQPA